MRSIKEYLNGVLNEDEFTDNSLKRLSILKIEQKIRETEKNNKIHPIKKTVLISDLKKRLQKMKEEYNKKSK